MSYGSGVARAGLFCVALCAALDTPEPRQLQAIADGATVPAAGKGKSSLPILSEAETNADLSSSLWIVHNFDVAAESSSKKLTYNARTVLSTVEVIPPAEGVATQYLMHADIHCSLPRADEVVWLFDAQAARKDLWVKHASASMLAGNGQRHKAVPECTPGRKRWCEVPTALVAFAKARELPCAPPSVQRGLSKEDQAAWGHLFLKEHLRHGLRSYHVSALLFGVPQVLASSALVPPPCIVVDATGLATMSNAVGRIQDSDQAKALTLSYAGRLCVHDPRVSRIVPRKESEAQTTEAACADDETNTRGEDACPTDVDQDSDTSQGDDEERCDDGESSHDGETSDGDTDYDSGGEGYTRAATTSRALLTWSRCRCREHTTVTACSRGSLRRSTQRSPSSRR